ncbi:hypothetical protein [Lacinutrix salivirga]
MKNLNLLQVFMLAFCVTVTITSCTTEEKTFYENKTSNIIDIENESLKAKAIELNAILKQINKNYQKEIIINKFETNVLTKSMSDYLKANKTRDFTSNYIEINDIEMLSNLKMNVITFNNRKSVTNKSSEGILNTTIIDIEDDNEFKIMVEIITEKDVNSDAWTIIETNVIENDYNRGNNCHGSYTVACADANGDGEVSYGECFGACVGYALDTNEFSGKVIVYAGVAGGVGCVGCGIAAGALLGIISIGCAGGCA